MIPGREEREPATTIPDLLGALQRSVDRARADRLDARAARCDRRYPHGPHIYVATPRSAVDLECPGIRARRSIAELLEEHPEYRDLRLVGVLRHSLEVSAA